MYPLEAQGAMTHRTSKRPMLLAVISIVLQLCGSTLAQSEQTARTSEEAHPGEAESQAYKNWYDAWAQKDYLHAVDLGIRYLQEYPVGKYADYLKKRLKRPADPGSQQWSFLSQAIASLVDSGANVNARLEDGKTVLMLATIDGNVEVMQTFLQKGADVNTREYSNEWTALTYAIWSGNQGAIRLLVNSGADTQLKDKFGRTGLDNAVATRSSDIAGLLK
jgi:hypothetical protein